MSFTIWLVAQEVTHMIRKFPEMARKLSPKLVDRLASFAHNKVQSASWCDRHEYESLVRKGLLIKHHNGRLVTYTAA